MLNNRQFFGSLVCASLLSMTQFVLANNDDDLIPDSAAAHNVPNDSAPKGIYVQAGAGYGLTFMQRRLGTFANTTWNGHVGGFTALGDLGYQFNNLFAIETGGAYIPQSQIKYTLTNTTVTFKTWAAYLAGKMRVYLYDNTHLFAKAGVSYQQTSTSGSALPTLNGNQHAWGVLLGFGTEFNFTPSFSMSAEYLRIPGRVRNTATTMPPLSQSVVPDSNLLLLSLGYLFGQNTAS